MFVAGAWQFQAMTGDFAFAGIDMALWDLCGKACRQPLYRLFGGAVRDVVDYFHYLSWGSPGEVAEQCRSEPPPIATGPKWGRIDAPGLGVEIDEAKLAR